MKNLRSVKKLQVLKFKQVDTAIFSSVNGNGNLISGMRQTFHNLTLKNSFLFLRKLCLFSLLSHAASRRIVYTCTSHQFALSEKHAEKCCFLPALLISSNLLKRQVKTLPFLIFVSVGFVCSWHNFHPFKLIHFASAWSTAENCCRSSKSRKFRKGSPRYWQCRINRKSNKISSQLKVNKVLLGAWNCECGKLGYQQVFNFQFTFSPNQDESSVQNLIDRCIIEDDKLYICVSSPTIKNKPVQIRPWRLSDADFVLDASMSLDPRKTVFVGGVPRPLKACKFFFDNPAAAIFIDLLYLSVELAMIMDRLYGGVCYAGIDTDPELKYPKVNVLKKCKYWP